MELNCLILWISISIILCAATIRCIKSICSSKYHLKEMELKYKLEFEKLRIDEKLQIVKSNASNEELNKFVKQFNEIVSNELKEILDERLKNMGETGKTKN